MEPKWTKEQVVRLNAWQRSGKTDTFMGAVPKLDDDGQPVIEDGIPAMVEVPLIATPYGYVADEGGPIVRDWADGYLLMEDPPK